jgi:hypothetical protein
VSVAVRVRPGRKAVSRRRTGRPAFALARVEGRRLLRSPLVLVGALFSLALFVALTWDLAPVLHRDDVYTGLAAIPLAAGALMAANLAAGRSRRHGTEELYETSPVSPEDRTVGHVLSVAWPAALGVVVTAAQIGFLLALDPVGSPRVLELLTAPAIVALGGVAGILLARCWPSAIAGPVAVVAWAALQVFQLAYLHYPPSSLRWLFPWVPPPGTRASPEVVARPAGWHLVYLLGVVGVVATMTRLPRRVTLRPLAVVAAAVAVTVVAGGLQMQPPTTEVRRELAAQVMEADRYRVCETRGSVRYCAYPAYVPWIDRWASVVEGVLDPIPPPARATRIDIEQWLNAGDPPDLPREAIHLLSDPTRTGAIRLSTMWGRWAQERQDQLALGLVVSAWVVGLPRTQAEVVLHAEDIPIILRAYPRRMRAQIRRELQPGDEYGFCQVSGQARAVVALWLAARATPGAETLFREVVRSEPFELRVDTQEGGFVGYAGSEQSDLTFLASDVTGNSLPISWTRAEASYTAQLLDLPDQEVAETIGRSWDRLIAPEATTGDLLQTFGLIPIPAFDEQLRRAGYDPGLAEEYAGFETQYAEIPCR